ncbi:MAG: glycoside hydrolase family 9 protein [Victivallaceae bacterium]|nr:glycoside hydrolase family 9 protein [Victivallaceae bacterium]
MKQFVIGCSLLVAFVVAWIVLPDPFADGASEELIEEPLFETESAPAAAAAEKPEDGAKIKDREEVIAPWSSTASSGKKTDGICSSASGLESVRGRYLVRRLDGKNYVLTGNFHKFLCERFYLEKGTFLKELDLKQPPVKAWSREFHYNFRSAEIILKYRPLIAKKFSDGANFRVVASDGKVVPVAAFGSWINPVGQARFPDFAGGETLTHNAEVAHHAYFAFAEALKPGDYTVETPFGEKVPFTVRGNGEDRSWAIKYNQVGYLPEAGRKFAYAGSWRGTLGALPTGDAVNQFFTLRESVTGKEVFSGQMQRRINDADASGRGTFTGEEVLELDFSAFRRPGRYYLALPGIGRSGDFSIGQATAGEAFYLHARGLYHKRCGIAKSRPWTMWETGSCHKDTYRGVFSPHDRDYSAKRSEKDRKLDYGFFNADGKIMGVDHFQLIAQSKPNPEEVLPVSGGWHDAADYDRRGTHYSAVNDLLAVYLMFPKNFTDGQLNLPESGNGIPDLLDEALWGMEVWRKAQNPNGSVGGWIEADSHPKESDPAKDRQKYYLSLATRESTMNYAAHASMMALALRESGFPERSAIYRISAIRAWLYAIDPRHRARHSYRFRDRNGQEQQLEYQESNLVPPELEFKAAFNLYVLTGEEQYAAKLRALAGSMVRIFPNTGHQLSPLFFTEFARWHEKAPFLAGSYRYYRDNMIAQAVHRMEMQEKSYPYRISWYPPGHPFVSNMPWGNYHPLNRARTFVAAWYLTGEDKFRDAAAIANDFHNGANPLGVTMTSGLGEIYPVRFLDLISYSDKVGEFVPGITPYGNNYRIPRGDVALAHGLFYSGRPDHNFSGGAATVLPDALTGGKSLDRESTAKILSATWPVWRRNGNVEAYTVAASEYTVNETIAPAAAVAGALMGHGFTPSESLKERKPAQRLKELPGFMPLP